MIEEACQKLEQMRQEMQRDLEARRQENQKLRSQLNDNRRLNQADQENIQPEYNTALNDQRSRLQEVEAELKAEAQAKAQAIRQFDQIDANLAKQKQH